MPTFNWPRRYNVVLLSTLAVFVCYIDRVNISVAIIPMAADLDWGMRTQGMVLSSFFVGYLLLQIVGGLLADRFGGKVVLGVGCFAMVFVYDSDATRCVHWSWPVARHSNINGHG